VLRNSQQQQKLNKSNNGAWNVTPIRDKSFFSPIERKELLNLMGSSKLDLANVIAGQVFLGKWTTAAA
jgi:type II restriction/modification system DNA methylase subunit YeeA